MFKKRPCWHELILVYSMRVSCDHAGSLAKEFLRSMIDDWWEDCELNWDGCIYSKECVFICLVRRCHLLSADTWHSVILARCLGYLKSSARVLQAEISSTRLSEISTRANVAFPSWYFGSKLGWLLFKYGHFLCSSYLFCFQRLQAFFCGCSFSYFFLGLSKFLLSLFIYKML